MSKSYGDVLIPKGTIAYDSENGHYNYWYPNPEAPREMPMSVTCRHLYLWRNQGMYQAFAVPLMVFKPELISQAKKEYVCMWFKTEVIDDIVSSTST